MPNNLMQGHNNVMDIITGVVFFAVAQIQPWHSSLFVGTCCQAISY